MLLELEVKNFALIDKLHLQFEKGLNILTGETGAGKSIIIDAVNMAIGERADREFVRSGQNKCTVQAIFLCKDPYELEEILSSNGIDWEADGNIIVTREIYTNGRSIARVNGTIVTQTLLKKITEKLIDIHGQHQHQSLLNSLYHIDMLDAFGGDEIHELNLLIDKKYKQLSILKNQLKEICGNEMERERKIDLLKFQIEEINAAKLNIDEEEILLQQRNLLANSEKIYTVVADAYEGLYEGSNFPAVATTISKTVMQLHNIINYDDKLSYFYQALEEVQYKLDDLSRDIREYRDLIEFNPESIDEIERRLDLINSLKRKYGKSIKLILEYRDKIQKDLDILLNSEEEIIRLQKEIDKTKDELNIVSISLSELRKKAALLLERDLTAVLMDLNMKSVTFKVDIKQSIDANNNFKFTSKGIDQVEFILSANLGEQMKPLAKIASGGEMSRIMLALKTILADVDSINTLIFDEIDTGISGQTAHIVSEKLYEISKIHQVICITHLPQIASMAEAHYLISKNEEQGSTKTSVVRLDYNNRIKEVGRLLGGQLTDITIKHAKEMIDQSSLKRS
ncbi:DNA repair protein RecN [Alkaliphilus peptidifermentans]|uniref:DNA repair protein RecN n=1 Tax=Alkaliphilus peptidifermentans DSM 18978 TaxID=1120976 RepID=A0A1G5KEZ9_9FIRM|nr:DNA repair protein RecN [Alkaliphilus peptidifermentans]SCY98821.1 DNA replication and repair protein RecN [Alkaliphilus peptidifermentans DSM 18978]